MSIIFQNIRIINVVLEKHAITKVENALKYIFSITSLTFLLLYGFLIESQVAILVAVEKYSTTVITVVEYFSHRFTSLNNMLDSLR